MLAAVNIAIDEQKTFAGNYSFLFEEGFGKKMKNIRLILVTRVMVLKLVGQQCKGVAWSISICRSTAGNGYYSCIARTIKTCRPAVIEEMEQGK